MESTLDYQLKWSQHQSNLNSNIAALYRNNKYADVMLLCEEQSIPCHKIILSSTSMYFASIFEKLPQTPIMPIIYIVLPPDLTYQAMKILIHYMYRGESRVSNDILKEVLHAGDVLKVRGLYRNDTGKENKSSMNIEKPQTSILRPSTSHHMPPTTPLNTNIQNSMQLHPSEIQAQQKLVSVISPPSHSNNNISPIARSTNKNFDSITNFGGRKVTSVPLSNSVPAPINSKHARPSIESMSQKHHSSIDQSLKTPSSHLVNFLTTIKEEPIEWTEEYDINEIKCDRKQMFIKEEVNNSTNMSTIATSLPQTYQKLSCEICSEDFILPADWVRHVERHSEHTATVPRKRRRSGLEIDDENTASLRCDLCATYFVTPAQWVQHVQSRHTEMELAVENEKISQATTAGTSSSEESPTIMRPTHPKKLQKTLNVKH
uniref:CSON007036 protein n=1 Tax=Culicoides sonorensis TaxID=179676 RepID=A0A336LX71_CULSO